MGIKSLITHAYREATGTQTQFGRRSRVMAEKLDGRVTYDSPQSMLVYFKSEGSELPVNMICPDDKNVRIEVLSSVAFPRDRIPSSVRKILKMANKCFKGDDLKYVQFDGPKTSRAALRTHLELDQLTPETIEELIREILPLVQDFDSQLKAKGYA